MSVELVLFDSPTSNALNEIIFEGDGPLLSLLLEPLEEPLDEPLEVLGEVKEERTSFPALFQAACFSSARTRSLGIW